jgi:ribosomal protein S18 acetylase RimI-like enzyme
MPTDSASTPQIGEPTSERRRTALDFLATGSDMDLGGLFTASPPPAAQARGSLRLLEARRDGALIGVVGAHVRPGHTAEVLPPRLAPGEAESLAHALLLRVEQLLRLEQVRIAYVYTPATPNRLAQQGYTQGADVLVLVRPLGAIPSPHPGEELTYETWPAEDAARVDALVEATHVGSQDFPLPNGVLKIRDLLDGYAATGVSGRGLWRLVRQQGRDVGCLFVADHPRPEQCELVYLGLVPSVRGQGWGRQLVHFALRLASGLGRKQVTAAVAAGNDPALAMYAAAGFLVHEQLSAWWKLL